MNNRGSSKKRMGAALTGLSGALFFLCAAALFAGGKKDQIETVTAEGGEIWQHSFNVETRKSGKYNFVVNAKDQAGNETRSGPFNIVIDSEAGLPAARVVYPEDGAVMRTDINLIGVASGRFGISRVTVRLDDGEALAAQGTEYWSRLIGIRNLSEGVHTVYTQAYDSKGIAGPVMKVGFIVDKTPPVLELGSHKTGDIISGNITLSGSADDPNGIGSVFYSEDGENFRPVSCRTKKNETKADFSFQIRTAALNDGPAVYYIKAVDKTGYEAVKPYLFFVDNNGPELELFTPEADENVYGGFMLSGRVHDVVGLARFYYEWGGAAFDIPLRPGDPFWAVNLDMDSAVKHTGTIKISAVDKSGNISSVTRKLEDRRREKIPSLIIDYPPQSQLNSLSPEAYIYGHIAPGFEPEQVSIEGVSGSIPALPAFRISPDMIPQGRTSLKIIPRAAGLSGSPISLRINGKGQAAPEGRELSSISISAPAMNSWIGGSSFILEGNIPGVEDPSRLSAVQLEYRLHPEEGWRPVSVNSGGGFRAEISAVQLYQGPVHLELRTLRGGVEDIPVYHPLNRIASVPEIRFINAEKGQGQVNGSATVLGTVSTEVPIRSIEYSLDGANFQPLPYISRFGRAWFSYFCDFAALNAHNKSLVIRVTDSGGAVFERSPPFRFDPLADMPALIVNTPAEGQVITGDLEIAGLVFDDDAAAAVYWRISGPAPGDSPPIDGFRRIETSQSFQIPLAFAPLRDGEYVIELYAEDIYGVKSQTISRAIKVSTAAPETRIEEPLINVYSHKSVMIQGSARDANGIRQVYLSMDNGNTWQRAAMGENGAWSLALNTTSYRDGVYSALLRTEDAYGITAFANGMINIDNTPPELSLSSPANSARVGAELSVSGRVNDNIALKSLSMQLISQVNPGDTRTFELPAEQVLMKTIDIGGLPQGEYILRIAALDLADNESVVSRKFFYEVDDTASEVAIFNPMPGETLSGSLAVSGTVSGALVPKQVTLMLNGRSSALVEVDRYGVFRHEIPQEELSAPGPFVISAAYDTPSGRKIESPRHQVRYSPFGPSLAVDSHLDGDMITGRPWLSGRAWIALPETGDGKPRSRGEMSGYGVKQVLVSFDNGRSFGKALGGAQWKYRLETGDLPLGPLPVLIKAEFSGGQSAVRRLLLTVDTNAPHAAALAPAEDSTHRDSMVVYGTAGDDFELDSVQISLRPGDKAGYGVPRFIQGLYLDTHFLGATYADIGLGLSFFNDNVRIQFQAGIAPTEEESANSLADGGRYVGGVFGMKIIANVLYLPFDFFLGPDWSFFSMSVSLGANFSYFTMDKDRDGLFMGAVFAQWTFAGIDASKLFPKWRCFRSFSFYMEPEFWFASSDVNAEAIPRITFGLRVNIF
jgi:hypothetical protein